MKRFCMIFFLLLLLCAVLVAPASAETITPQGEVYGMSMNQETNTVTVQVKAAQDCTVIVALYSEQNSMLTLGSAGVKQNPAIQKVDVTLNGKVETFHHAKAFLLYGEGCLPICGEVSKDQIRLTETSQDNRGGEVQQQVDTTDDGSTTEKVSLTAGTTKIEIPAGSRLEENAAGLSAQIQAAETPAVLQIKQGADSTAVSYEIQLSGLPEENTSLVKVVLDVPCGLSDLKVYHREKELRKIDLSIEAADGTFLYDQTKGTLSIWTTSFSPFTLSFGTYKNWQDDFHDHTEAAKTYGYALVANGQVRKDGNTYYANLVDFTGTVHRDVAVSEALYTALSDFAGSHDVLIRFETDDNGIMGSVTVAEYLENGVTIGGGQAEFGEYALYNKSRTLIWGGGTTAYRNVTGYHALKDTYTAGNGTAIQYLRNLSTGDVDCVLVYCGQEIPVYEYAYVEYYSAYYGTATLIDLAGIRHEDVPVSESFHAVMEAEGYDSHPLIRFEIEDNNMGHVELAQTAPDGSDINGADYILVEDEVYVHEKTRFLICTVGEDGSRTYEWAKGYSPLPVGYTYTAGDGTRIQYLLDSGSSHYAECVLIEKDVRYVYAYVIGHSLKKTANAMLGGAVQSYTYEADLVDFSGNIHEGQEIPRSAYELLEKQNSDQGMLMRYVLDDAGEIAEVELAAFAPEGADVSESDYLLAEEEAYITATTRFLIRTVGKDSTYVYTPVTGYQNLPDTYRVDANTSVQYLHVEGNRYFVSCAVICAELPASAPEQFILTKAVNLTSFGDIPSEYRDYNAYYGIVGGELAIMLMDPIMPAKMGALYEEAEISHIGITADGLPIFSCVSAARYENRLTGVVGANGFLQTEGGEILQCADDTKIFLLYQTEEGQWEVSAAASIPEGNADAYILKNEHEQLTEIYLLITA